MKVCKREEETDTYTFASHKRACIIHIARFVTNMKRATTTRLLCVISFCAACDVPTLFYKWSKRILTLRPSCPHCLCCASWPQLRSWRSGRGQRTLFSTNARDLLWSSCIIVCTGLQEALRHWHRIWYVLPPNFSPWDYAHAVNWNAPV